MAAISKDHQEIGLKISKLRDQAGMAQIDLAEELGVNKKTVGAMERGESDFGISKFISVCEALNASPSEILPDRLKAKSPLSQDMQKLSDRLESLTPYQRSQVMALINATIDTVINVTR